MAVVSPLARRLRLGAEIRRLREQRGMTGAELGRAAGLDRTAISKVENGERRPLPALMSIIDILLDPDGPENRSLVRVARDGLERGWWQESAYAGMGDRQARTADLECGVASICAYQSSMLPGLLQTEAYARHRAELAIAGGALIDLEGSTAGRLRRQREILGPDGPAYDVVLEPQAIWRAPVPPAVMVEQLTHLLDLIKTRPGLRVRVLPVDARLGSGYVPRSPFVVYTYPDPADLTLVAVDTVSTDLLVTAPAESERYAQMHQQLCAAALSEEDSAGLIQQAADAMAAI